MDPNNNPNNIQQDSGSSTVSHLPILFANGYPTSLERMSEEKLEEFIPFLLKCSGSITEKNLKPTWWPDSVNFTIPFCRPENFEGVREKIEIFFEIFTYISKFPQDWKETMKDIVLKCYCHYKSEFLLTYSKELSEHDPTCLRFVSNHNNLNTTSLYHKVSKKLLLIFKNENMVSFCIRLPNFL